MKRLPALLPLLLCVLLSGCMTPARQARIARHKEMVREMMQKPPLPEGVWGGFLRNVADNKALASTAATLAVWWMRERMRV